MQNNDSLLLAVNCKTGTSPMCELTMICQLFVPFSQGMNIFTTKECPSRVPLRYGAKVDRELQRKD